MILYRFRVESGTGISYFLLAPDEEILFVKDPEDATLVAPELVSDEMVEEIHKAAKAAFVSCRMVEEVLAVTITEVIESYECDL